MNATEAFWTGKPIAVGEFPSAIMPDRKIVLIAKLNDHNSKTGRMIQQGCSRSQCGAFDACYVRNFHFHIMRIQEALQSYIDGKIPKMTFNSFLNLVRKCNSPVRFGEFGDPCSISFDIVSKIAKVSRIGHSGYTHQWKTADQRFSTILMASVENEKDYQLAKSMGWKSFGINLPAVKGERINCPADKQAYKCETCLLCHGNKAKVSIVIESHGHGKKKLPVLA
jgi:hypothetical protein